MTVDDLNKACNYTPDITARYAYYPSGTSVSRTIEYNGNSYTKIAHNGTTAKFYVNDGGGVEKKDGEFTYRVPQADNPVYVTGTYYYYTPDSTIGDILGSSCGWLASPCVNANSTGARFNVHNAKNSLVSASNLLNSSGSAYSYSNRIRPIVSLNSTIKIDTSDVTKDGSTPEKAWELIKK